jgi:LPXTG-motif cell wall-anchored protein
MSLAARRAAPLAAVLACALPAPVARAAGEPPAPLRAQIAQATPTPRLGAEIAQATPTPGGEPPISGTPPVPLATPTPTPTATPTPSATATPSASPAGRDALPQTGSDADLLALTGLGLLALGAGLRLASADGVRD